MSEEMNWQIVGYMAALQFRAEQAELIVNEEYSDLGYRPGHGIRTYKEIAKELEAERTARKEAESEQDTLQAKLESAAAPFAAFLGFVEALRELDGDPELEDHAIVGQVSGGGGSTSICIGDFRQLIAALTPKEK
jgi:hypothetical protein